VEIYLHPIRVLFDGIGYFKKNQRLHFVAWLNLMVTDLTILLAIASGLLAKSRLAYELLAPPALVNLADFWKQRFHKK
jgi:uncharacterized membrane protein